MYLSKYILSKFLSLFSLIVSHPGHVLIKFGGSQLLWLRYMTSKVQAFVQTEGNKYICKYQT